MANQIRAAAVFTDRGFPLSCRRHEAHANTELHRHEFHELVVILSGRGRHVTDAGTYDIEAGDAFLVRGDMAHGYAHTDQMTLVNILFDPRRLRLPMENLRDLPGYHALFRVEPRLRMQDRFRSRLRLPPEDLAEAAAIIARLQDELRKQTPGYRFMACTHLMNLIGHLSRGYSRIRPTGSRPLLKMGEVLSFIERHHAERISVRQLMKIAGMSESTLMRTFRRVMGRSPIEHVIRVRVGKASELLQRGDVRVTEAAFQAGFSDSNYFSRQFRRVTGVTPRRFRDRYVAENRRVLPKAGRAAGKGA